MRDVGHIFLMLWYWGTFPLQWVTVACLVFFLLGMICGIVVG